ncbi:PREDICTED: collagen alpha-1(III) chain-like [Chrysochloris asiatica]|uniref:Collagen alpha-1(III) chain-like n=1 Tax=Chrysochloris asiatica TaxID=185453 RepID=A0A9B0WMU8_CHRAS|nr:PREDICTED: collagen alpha-1(III) chain-like [Chrysochloris asiatica]
MIPAVSSAERPGLVFVFSPPPTPPRGRVPRAALPTRPGGPRGAPLLRCARSLLSPPPRRLRLRAGGGGGGGGGGGRGAGGSAAPGFGGSGPGSPGSFPPSPCLGMRGAEEGGREGAEGEGTGREGAGGGGPGTGGLEGARQQPGRWEVKSERGPGRASCLPSPAAAVAETAARQRAGEQAGGLTERLERPTLLQVPLTPTRGSALPFCPAPSRSPGKPGLEHGAGAGRGTDSLSSPHKGGGEENEPRRQQALCRFRSAAQPLKASVKTRPGALASPESVPPPPPSPSSYPGGF